MVAWKVCRRRLPLSTYATSIHLLKDIQERTPIGSLGKRWLEVDRRIGKTALVLPSSRSDVVLHAGVAG